MRDGKEGGLSEEGRARGIQWLKVVPEDPQGGMLMIAPVSPAEFLPARPEGVSSKHKDREVSPFEKSDMSWGRRFG